MNSFHELSFLVTNAAKFCNGTSSFFTGDWTLILSNLDGNCSQAPHILPESILLPAIDCTLHSALFNDLSIVICFLKNVWYFLRNWGVMVMGKSEEIKIGFYSICLAILATYRLPNGLDLHVFDMLKFSDTFQPFCMQNTA